jgi:hypothetical protein
MITKRSKSYRHSLSRLTGVEKLLNGDTDTDSGTSTCRRNTSRMNKGWSSCVCPLLRSGANRLLETSSVSLFGLRRR